jgi:hypothetical protein
MQPESRRIMLKIIAMAGILMEEAPFHRLSSF